MLLEKIFFYNFSNVTFARQAISVHGTWGSHRVNGITVISGLIAWLVT